MGLGSAVRNFVKELRADPLNNPAVPLSAAGWISWIFGGEPTASGEVINELTALQEITVYACTRVIAESVASLPCRLYRVSKNGRQEETDNDLAYRLRYEPNSEMTALTFWEALTGSMALTGNGYAEIQRDRAGRDIAYWPLHPRMTTPKRNGANGELYYETTDGEAQGRLRQIEAANMIHVPLFCFNGVYGLSPIQLARQGIGLARAAEKYGARYFGNGARPGGILAKKSGGGPMDPDAKDKMKKTWEETQGGDNQGRVAVLSGDWTYQAIGMSPEESQFLATRQFQRAELAALFRVPPHLVGDTTRMSNNNAEQQNLSFVIDTLRPYICRIEQEITRKLLPKQGRNAGSFQVEFDVSERLRGDFKTTMDGLGTGRQWGFYSINDGKRKLGDNPIGPEGDVYLVPVNMQNAKRLLDTEPALDQPLNADPARPTPAGKDDKPPVPTEDERNMLGRYTQAYINVWNDSFKRLLKRDKRDSAAINGIFTPVMQSIAELSAGAVEPVPDGIVAAALAAMTKRAASWPADVPSETVEAEFIKAVRTIHINIAKEVSAAHAAAEVASV
jgi:HK97 family phage portal protein